MPGTVVTFYSYKGGVGRSFTLANIAVLLARWGYRVLCVDWDLEAPGLNHYFGPMMKTQPAGGVVDMIDDFIAGGSTSVDHTVRLTMTGTLDFIAAGRDDSDYVGRIQGMDWESLYRIGFGEYLEKCRDRWTSYYDFVLLDSRTGVSDVGGICTAHLPDRLVVLFTANMQSIRGAVDIAKRANEARDAMPYDRPQLTVLPVLSRFDTREEYDRSEEWRQVCLRETEELYRNWLHRDVETRTMSRHLTLPYVSYWSFGEQIPARSEANPSADQIGFALETVAAVVAHNFDRTDLLAENRDAYVAAIRSGNREFAHLIRVSSPRSTLDVADALISELTDLDVQAVLSMSGERSLLTKSEDDARHLCLLIDGSLSRWQLAEVELFLHRTLGQDRRVIPVLTEGTEPNALPGYVGNLRYLQLTPSLGPAEVARGLADQLNGVTITGPAELIAILRQLTQTTLRPSLWEVVDEVVHDMNAAVAARDGAEAQKLGAGLAQMVKSFATKSDVRSAAPGETQAAISAVVRMLEARDNGFLTE